MSRRSPVTISLNAAELHRLDTWARHHDMNRSEAFRRLLMAARLPGQATLDLDDAADAEVLGDVDVSALERHATWCSEASRKTWGASSPFNRHGACPVCWPDGSPTRDQCDVAWTVWRREQKRGIAAAAKVPGWAVWRFMEDAQEHWTEGDAAPRPTWWSE